MRSWLRLLLFRVVGGGLGVAALLGSAGPETSPRVVDAWPASPFEVYIWFDRPIGNDIVQAAVGRTIAFDTRRPNVASPTPRGAQPDAQGSIRVAAARLADEGKTLILTTDPHSRAATYTLRLPRQGSAPIVAEYDLSGVEVAWGEGKEGASPFYVGRWTALSPAPVAEGRRTLSTERSAGRLKAKGKLSLSTLVRLPKGPLIVRVTASAPIEATLGGEEPVAPEALDAAAAPAGQSAVFRVESTGEPMLLLLSIKTGGPTDKPMSARMVVRRDGTSKGETDVRPDQFLLPWTPAEPPPAPPLENVPNLAGGDPIKGRAVFMGAEAKCSTCHKVRGEGTEIGPDLSPLVGRDRTEVYRDLYAPSARIHPNYVSYTVALKSGRVLVGTVRAEGADAVRVTDAEAKVSTLKRSEIEEFRPSATSIMPVGLVGAIGDERLCDLIAFLTSPPAK